MSATCRIPVGSLLLVLLLAPAGAQFSDEFSAAELAGGWRVEQHTRTGRFEPLPYRLGDNGLALSVEAGDYALLLREPVVGNLEVSADLTVSDGPAGLVLQLRPGELVAFARPVGDQAVLALCHEGRWDALPAVLVPQDTRHLKLARHYRRFTASVSADGEQWAEVAHLSASLDEELSPGVICSAPGPAASATFRSFSWRPLANDRCVLAIGLPDGGSVATSRDPCTMRAIVSNLTDAEYQAVLRWRCTDIYQRPVLDRTIPLVVPAAAHMEVPLTLDTGLWGAYVNYVSLTTGDDLLAAPVNATITVQPPPVADQVSRASIFSRCRRLWDSHTWWAELEPEPGKWTWEKLDKIIADADGSGTEILYVLGLPPAWASTTPDKDFGWYGKGVLGCPRDLDEWRNYVRQVVTRYRGRIRYYEVWNEPNEQGEQEELHGYFYGTIPDYVNLLKSAYEIVKEVDPEAQVMGISGTGNYFYFMKRCFELGALDSMDIVSVHWYTIPGAPEIGACEAEGHTLSRYERTRTLMRAAGRPDKPVWVTEIGWNAAPRINDRPMTAEEVLQRARPDTYPSWDPGWPGRPNDEYSTAAWAVRSLLYVMSCGINRWYVWGGLGDIGGMGLAVAGDIVRDATVQGRMDLGRDDAYAFRFGDSARTIVTLWSVQERPSVVEVRLPRGDAQLLDFCRNPMPEQPSFGRVKLQLSEFPAYLVINRPDAEVRAHVLYTPPAVAEPFGPVFQPLPTAADEAVSRALQPVDLGGAAFSEGDAWSGGWMNPGGKYGWTVGDIAAGVYRIIANVRTGTGAWPGTNMVGGYDVCLNDEPVPTMLWPAKPIESGDGIHFMGQMASQRPLRVKPGDTITVASRTYSAFCGKVVLLPQALAAQP